MNILEKIKKELTQYLQENEFNIKLRIKHDKIEIFIEGTEINELLLTELEIVHFLKNYPEYYVESITGVNPVIVIISQK